MNQLGYRFCSVNETGNKFQIRLIYCESERTIFSAACKHCQALVTKVEKIYKNSLKPLGTLNYLYQTHHQLVLGSQAKSKIIQQLKLEVKYNYHLEVDLNPSQFKTNQAMDFFSHLLHCLIQPYINSTLSLTEQVKLLVEVQHIMLILYRKNAKAFSPLQLYGDKGVMIKNIMFYIVKQQLWDSSCGVSLSLTRDDGLETLFGQVCMQGAHNANCGMKSLVNQLCAAMDLNQVFTRHPSWDQGHH
jgi:hypothetical protein